MQKRAILLWSVMCRFLKFIPSDEALWLLVEKPNAFRLLTFIANTARRYNGHPDGLLIGQCHLQHWTFYKLTEQEYRTAKRILVERQHLKIIETNRTRKKSTTGTTTASTLVQLCSTTVYDINYEDINDRINDRATTDQRLPNDKQERIRKKKKEKESHPSIPSFESDEPNRDDGGMTDDFSFEKEKIEIVKGVFISQADLDSCMKIKGSLEKVKHAIEFIQGSKKRKHPIGDWPNALSKWKIENKTKNKVQEHVAYAEKLCEEFPEFENGRGWRCYIYNHGQKDQRGILFENSSGYQEAFFVALTDGEFQRKCEDFIRNKNMRKK